MNFVGKILIVLHLAFSVLFMAFAGAVYTAQTNWRKEAEAAKLKVSAVEKQLRERTDDRDRSEELRKQETAAYENRITTLTGEVSTLKTDSANLTADNQQLRTLLDTERELAALTSEEARDRVRESQLQRAKNLELHRTRDDLVVKVRELEDKNFSLNLKLQQIEAKHDDVLKDLGALRSYLAANNLPTDPKLLIAQSAPPPPVDGLILESRKAEKGSLEFVEISLGRDDGLVKGHTLTVYREDRYLGRIQVVEVGYDTAVAKVVEKAKNSSIQRGDNVSTKL